MVWSSVFSIVKVLKKIHITFKYLHCRQWEKELKEQSRCQRSKENCALVSKSTLGGFIKINNLADQIVKIYLYLYEKWHNVKIFLLKISGKAHGATGDVACDGYNKYKVCMPSSIIL